jgi:dipeptidyl aminopeptidase/acylaminoacyl peptidase
MRARADHLQPMRPTDIERIVVVEEIDVAYDGSFAVVVRRVVRRGEYEGHLFVVDLERRTTPRRLTTGRVRDSWPRVSPDGRSVAFVRSWVDDDDRPAELCTVRVRGGRVRVVAPHGASPGFGSVDELAWSPDGSRIAFVAAVDPPRFVVGARPAIGTKAARSSKLRTPTARRISRADWRWDEVGHRDHWSHLFVVPTDGSGPPRQVTDGDWAVSSIAWHPDGRTVAFEADLGDDPDLCPCSSIWAIDVDAGPRSKRSRPWPILGTGAPITKPAFSPDGRWLAAVGSLDPEPLDDVSPGLLLVRTDGSDGPIALSADLDRPIGSWCDTDLHGWMVHGRTGPAWLDAATIVAAVTDRGRSLPERWVLDPASGALVDGPSVSDRDATGPWAEVTVHQLAVAPGAPSEGQVVLLGTLDGRAMDVMTVDLAVVQAGRRFRHHSTFGSAWQRRFVQPEMRRIEVPGPGGPIETWVASPPGAGAAALPTIVDVHGGPLGGWAPSPHVEVIMLVGAGYRVVLPNIRGGAGYGADWIRPQLGDWGGVDVDDVHAAVDHVVGLGWADPTRLGIMGLSYGGFVVNWIVGTSDRFRAAVSENGVANQVAVWANSDSGPEYCRAALLGDPFSSEGVERLWRQSPLRHVANVRTPLLMLQAESDLRCPASDNEQFFVALRHLRREVEYVLYPESYHTFASNGRPDRRIDRMDRVLTWFATHLT